MIEESNNEARVAEVDVLGGNTSRRSFLALGGALGTTLLMAGCSGGSDSAAGSDASSEDVLRVGMEVNYAPYNWQTDTETDYTIPVDGLDNAYADGYDVSVSKLLGELLGKTPVAIKLPYAQLIDNCKQGNVDLIVAGMTATPEREESIDFTDEYWEDFYGLLVRADGDYVNATSLADFSGATVIGQKSTLLDDIIDDIPGVNHGTPVDSVSAQINALKGGTCDAITYNMANKDGFLEANPELVSVNFDDGEGFTETEICNIGLAKGQDDLKKKINDWLADFSQDERQKLWDEACDRQPK